MGVSAMTTLAPRTTTIIPTTKLSPAEREILIELCKGKYLTTIARDRGVCLRTCEHQLVNARQKIGAKNMHHACAMWVRAECEGVEL
jgi:DNA-binding NarL/FixJ family response regulator